MGCIVSSTAQHVELLEVESAHLKALSCTMPGSHQSIGAQLLQEAESSYSSPHGSAPKPLAAKVV